MSAFGQDQTSDVLDAEFSRLIEEISEKIQTQQPVDIDAYCTNYPRCADALQQLVPSMKMLADWGDGASHPSNSLADGLPLGDFRLLREIGRGGMGVVYEAEQLSLRRRVALKVLPFAAMMDPAHLQRFHNEAHAAAHLHHPHIVPVHAVGSERGIHFFAMQLIEGRSVAEMIQALKLPTSENSSSHSVDAIPLADQVDSPTNDTRPVAQLSTRANGEANERFLNVARLGIEAADALHYAHTQGIVHRDVKPANFMIDQSGALWVTDFGLAITNNDVSLTATQEMIGTLRYMSPEQATGAFVLDHRTDVYSLGLTLYEMVSLHPAFPDQNRQKLLRDIEIADPEPLQKINRKIPAELVTIINKSIEKHPADRYSTAEELRDDLQRFLDHRPLKAKRPTLLHRSVKWTRRNRTLAIACAVAILFVSVASTVSSFLVLNAYRREAQQRQVAESSRADAEQKLQLASDAIENLLVKMAEQAKAGNQLPSAAAFLDDAASLYEQLSARHTDPQLSQQIARGHLRIGEVQELLAQHEQAQSAYEHAIRLLSDIEIESNVVTESLLSELSLAQRGRADNLWALNHYAKAEAPYLDAQATLRRIPGTEESDSVAIRLAEIDVNLGLVYWTTGRLDQAEQAYKQALKTFDAHKDEIESSRFDSMIGSTVGNLAILSRERGNLADARVFLDRAYTYHSSNFESGPNDPHARLAFYHAVWNDAHLSILEEDIRQADKAARLLVETFPNRLSSYVEAAKFQLRCAELASPSDRESHIEMAKQFIEGVDGEHVSHREPVYQNVLANLLLDATPVELRDIDRAFEMASKLARDYPNRWDFRQTLAKSHYRQGNFEMALEHLHRSVEIHGEADWSNTFWLAMTHMALGSNAKAIELWNDVKNVSSESIDTENRFEFRRLRSEAADAADKSIEK